MYEDVCLVVLRRLYFWCRWGMRLVVNRIVGVWVLKVFWCLWMLLLVVLWWGSFDWFILVVVGVFFGLIVVEMRFVLLLIYIFGFLCLLLRIWNLNVWCGSWLVFSLVFFGLKGVFMFLWLVENFLDLSMLVNFIFFKMFIYV